MAKANWANKQKEAVATVPLSKPTKDRGERFNATIDNAEAVSYSTGSFGIKIKYVVEGLERAVYENVVLRTLDKETGDPKPTQYGETTFKRRLQAIGLSSDEINGFAIPRTPAQSEHLAVLKGSKVVVYLADREYMGKTYKDVKAVWPLDNE